MDAEDYMNGNDLRLDQGQGAELRSDLGQDGYLYRERPSPPLSARGLGLDLTGRVLLVLFLAGGFFGVALWLLGAPFWPGAGPVIIEGFGLAAVFALGAWKTRP